jgi:ABC-type sugar transport system substrate-binding protein
MIGQGALSGLLVALGVSCGRRDHSSVPTNRSATIAAVIKGLDNPFFATMRNGLVETAGQHNARLRVDAAAGLQDTTGQAATLHSSATQREACYIVNPINRTNLIRPLSHVPEGTPIVNIDSPIDQNAAKAMGVEITTYIGTDNVGAGGVAADAIAHLVPRGASVAIITGIPGDAGSEARTRGFKEGARGRFNIVQTIAADFDPERARLAAQDLLRASPSIQGFFAVNDQMALGVAAAVRAAGESGQVAVTGMDGIPDALAAVKSGAMSATVAQYPYIIGQLGVEACLAAMRGKSVPANVAAPVQVVTKENVERAQANFPQPVEPFNDPLARLLKG